jgi:hypothetical protein
LLRLLLALQSMTAGIEDLWGYYARQAESNCDDEF